MEARMLGSFGQGALYLVDVNVGGVTPATPLTLGGSYLTVYSSKIPVLVQSDNGPTAVLWDGMSYSQEKQWTSVTFSVPTCVTYSGPPFDVEVIVYVGNAPLGELTGVHGWKNVTLGQQSKFQNITPPLALPDQSGALTSIYIFKNDLTHGGAYLYVQCRLIRRIQTVMTLPLGATWEAVVYDSLTQAEGARAQVGNPLIIDSGGALFFNIANGSSSFVAVDTLETYAALPYPLNQ